VKLKDRSTFNAKKTSFSPQILVDDGFTFNFTNQGFQGKLKIFRNTSKKEQNRLAVL